MLQKFQFSLLNNVYSLIISLLSLLLSFSSQGTSEYQHKDNFSTHKLAEITSQLGHQFNQSQSPTDAAQAIAAQQLSSAVTATFTPWLNQFGNVRFSLPFDHTFSLKEAALDWVLPWYTTPTDAAFSQWGAKAGQGQATTHLGMGYRYLADNWLWGANAFWDAEWLAQHHCYSIGIEAWHDNLKLSANLYQRLSGWKASRKVTDYDARPANGWDIRAEGGLPVLPHWSGQVVFEQYDGQEVNLFGDSKRQRNPYSLTAGLTYTPVPLITLGADVRQGKQDQRDSRFTLALNYQLGVPLAQQLDPNAVAPLRSLTFKRTDFVNRRHDMVLDHRKQTLMTLDFPAQIIGEAGKTVTFTPRITAKYPLARLELRADELHRAGGKIVHQMPDKVTLLLPKARDKMIRLSGIAIDRHGNRSPPSETTIFIQPTETHVQVTANRTQAKADGQDSVRYTVVVKDRDGEPVSDQTVNWSSDKGELSQAIQKTDAQGLATVLLRSHHHGEHRVQVSVGEHVTVALPVHFSAALKSVITTDKTQARADGQDAVTFTVTVKDAAGIPIPHQAVIWHTDNGVLSSVETRTDSKGEAHVQLTSTVAGEHRVWAQVDDETVTAPTLWFDDVLAATFRADKPRIIANGQDSATLTVTVKKLTGQPAVGLPVWWRSNHGHFTTAQIHTDKNGEARATLTSQKAGPASVTAIIDDWEVISPIVKFIPPLRVADTVAVDSQGGNANQKSFGPRGPTVFWRGAKFRIITDGHTGRVNWQSDSPAVIISGDTVVIQQQPDGARLTGTDETGQQVILTLTSYIWFERSGLTKDFYFNATQICQSLGSQVAPKYAFERLYEEWGNFHYYEGWVREFYVVSTDYLSTYASQSGGQVKWAYSAGRNEWMRNAWVWLAFACGG
ncbi:inverse autotransporter beta domain-containing protein [Xenorhabdus sp. M]|uniref:Inverse autotransporter beta domain-containing protein n=1 Tax=Xenorhabdus szentirmaii TaxID=290112 RepID=A0AAW3YS40_9GAMM|nr:inverse autotransporter beta domain-containing protein [Xenorhabdus sp. M]MBD2799924.1 inverse autotransporter beta domain-containing protein [Xenorhabdus sp. M]